MNPSQTTVTMTPAMLDAAEALANTDMDTLIETEGAVEDMRELLGTAVAYIRSRNAQSTESAAQSTEKGQS